MKRLTLSVLAVLAVLGLAACGKGNGNNQPPQGPSHGEGE